MKRRYPALLLLFLLCVFLTSPLHALLIGGGAEPMQDRGWPAGSTELANLKTRIAWWEGPPFGGGQYHFEYSGKTADLQKAIDLFAKVDAKRKQIVVRAGKQASFWLNIGKKEGEKSSMDWQFVVWVPGNWEQLKGARHGLLPPGEEGDSPKTLLNVYLTKRIKWDKLNIPKSLRVVDLRLEANGIAADQGGALRGNVTDADGKAIVGATVKLGKESSAGKATTDANGDFLITRIPEGQHQVIVGAQGFATKDMYYHAFDKTSFQQMSVQLAPAANITVKLVDQQNQPLPKVGIRVANCIDERGDYYRTAGDQRFTSDENGEISISDVPRGKIKFISSTREYYYNSVLNEHATDEDPIVLKLQRTGSLKVSVVTKDGNPVTSKYNISIAQEGVDEKKDGGVGTWGGSGNIRDDGTIIFHNIPPARYVVTGKPNPGPVNKTTEPVTVEIRGKDRYSIEIVAR